GAERSGGARGGTRCSSAAASAPPASQHPGGSRAAHGEEEERAAPRGAGRHRRGWDRGGGRGRGRSGRWGPVRNGTGPGTGQEPEGRGRSRSRGGRWYQVGDGVGPGRGPRAGPGRELGLGPGREPGPGPREGGTGPEAGAGSARVVGWGFSKVVLRAALAGGGAVALKAVHGGGREVRQCVQRYAAPDGCRRLAAYKLLKEAALLRRLRHPGIVQVRGAARLRGARGPRRSGVRLAGGGNASVLHPASHICLSLVKLLFYLAHSPLGSIVLLDFQPRQFVMVDGNLKVTDMDDASTEELSCKEDNDCTLEFPTKSFPLKCSAVGKCEGINEKKNLFNAYRYFFTYLLPHSAPLPLQPFLRDILNATGDLRYGINETLKAFEKVLHLYKSGLYLQKRPLLLKEYISLKGFRTVEAEDYKCWPSYSHLGCLLSVHSAEEAAAICNSQSQCQSFIVTQQRTWTGRPLASFQSSPTDLIPDVNAVVYIKRSASSGERL
uniref:Extracellular tyrosine-protein kinase PKDCC-like n=1 Tax=Nothoprocta perdicaria TaxID=30464 RepID=A0A8C6ZBY9_NOTPE